MSSSGAYQHHVEFFEVSGALESIKSISRTVPICKLSITELVARKQATQLGHELTWLGHSWRATDEHRPLGLV